MERRDLTLDAIVMMTNQDPQADLESQRPQPEGEQIPVRIGPNKDQTVKLGQIYPLRLKGNLLNC
jgi:hypothetical protein